MRTTLFLAMLVAVVWAGAFAVAFAVVEWRTDDADSTARDFLGAWDKDLPQSVRADLRQEFLAGETPWVVGNSGTTPSDQLFTALARIANAAALPLLEGDLAQLQTPKERLDRLSECLEYLMGTHDAATACNLQSIAR